MRARRRGHLVVVSSVMGYVGTPMRSSYAAAKHALHGYFDSLRAEVWREGIKVTIVCPGYVRTAVSDNALTASGARHARTNRTQARGIAPGRCAAAILWGIARGRERSPWAGRRFSASGCNGFSRGCSRASRGTWISDNRTNRDKRTDLVARRASGCRIGGDSYL